MSIPVLIQPALIITPQNILTEINVQVPTKTQISTQTIPPSPISVFEPAAVAILVVAALFAVVIMRNRSRETRKSG